jgi:hypothetical protein
LPGRNKGRPSPLADITAAIFAARANAVMSFMAFGALFVLFPRMFVFNYFVLSGLVGFVARRSRHWNIRQDKR